MDYTRNLAAWYTVGYLALSVEEGEKRVQLGTVSALGAIWLLLDLRTKFAQQVAPLVPLHMRNDSASYAIWTGSILADVALRFFVSEYSLRALGCSFSKERLFHIWGRTSATAVIMSLFSESMNRLFFPHDLENSLDFTPLWKV